ncbi:MAG: V-type ATPase subunit [Nanoarchaeota archaeon]|nr:V-type ATPase subunit [Nanoarchaeota archaeon]MCA9496100.1 V-type ATPase subunit [Nanoarchaeota archaeon]
MAKILNMKASSFECGKISAKRNKLISDEKFESLLSLSFDEIIKFLEEHGFRESVDSSFLQFQGFYLIERILNMQLSKIYAQVFASASKQNKILLETYYLKYQIHNLMVLIRCKNSGEKEFEPFLIGDERKKSKFIKAFEMPKLEDAIVYISKKLKFDEHEVLDSYSKGIYYLENYLYKKYYEKLNASKFKFNGIDENKFFNFTKTYIDLLNARSLMKFLLEGEKTLLFDDIFIKGGNLNLDYFEKLKSSSINDLLKEFETKFSDIKVNDENLSSIAILDKKINILKSNSRDVLKIASFGSPFYILKYLFDLEFQTSRLRILLKSKYLGLKKEEIKNIM